MRSSGTRSGARRCTPRRGPRGLGIRLRGALVIRLPGPLGTRLPPVLGIRRPRVLGTRLPGPLGIRRLRVPGIRLLRLLGIRLPRVLGIRLPRLLGIRLPRVLQRHRPGCRRPHRRRPRHRRADARAFAKEGINTLKLGRAISGHCQGPSFKRRLCACSSGSFRWSRRDGFGCFVRLAVNPMLWASTSGSIQASRRGLILSL
jgi:hypothetical protein